jgi:hypothetical protein
MIGTIYDANVKAGKILAPTAVLKLIPTRHVEKRTGTANWRLRAA